jgi:ABC-type multidrug transport system ATPase subunit
MTNDCLAAITAAHKRYGKTVALDGLDLEVRRGELLAVLGPNGAGKTTAISLMLGLQQPDSGVVTLFGKSPQSLETRRNIGVMMQEAVLAEELRVREQIDLAASYYPDPLTPDEVLQMTHTEALAYRTYGKLSGGQKRQAQFAVAVCGRPKLLFLDEPTVGLDVKARAAMWEILRQLVKDGASIVLTTHYIEEAEALADRVAVIAKGRLIASGTVTEMRSLIARRRITCTTQLSLGEIKGWPGVEGVTQDRDQLHITASKAEAIARRLLNTDETIQDMEIQRAGLADAFTELTQEMTQ